MAILHGLAPAAKNRVGATLKLVWACSGFVLFVSFVVNIRLRLGVALALWLIADS